jgi:hypothetical protein
MPGCVTLFGNATLVTAKWVSPRVPLLKKCISRKACSNGFGLLFFYPFGLPLIVFEDIQRSLNPATSLSLNAPVPVRNASGFISELDRRG